MILGATRNCGRRNYMEIVKSPEMILITTVLEKILSIKDLELVVTL